MKKTIVLSAVGAIVALFVAGSAHAATDCTVTVTAGGNGGGPGSSGYDLNLGWGIGIDNKNGSAPCSVSVSPSETPTAAWNGPSYTAAAGRSIGEGPSMWVRGVDVPYSVSITANSVTCPGGNSPVASGGSTASCSLNLGNCSIDGYGNRICNVNGCSASKTITCPSVPKAPSVSLSASPTSVPWYGGSVTLSWTVSDATSCTASGSWSGSKSSSNGSHSEKVTILPLTGDKSYSITCTGPGGSKTSSASVTMGKNNPPSVSIGSPSNGAQITKGTSVSVSASASDSDGGVSKVVFFVNGASIGSDSTAPYTASWNASSVGSYTISVVATDTAGATANDSVSISVTSPVVHSKPVVSLSASPANVSWWTGGDVVLTWAVSGATSCSASNAWSGSKASSDGSHNQTVSIGMFSSPKTYALTCTGPGGSSSDSVTVNVGNDDLCSNLDGNQTTVPAGYSRNSNGTCSQATPSVSLTVDPSTISSPRSVTLSWTADNVDSCAASGGWSGSKAASGSQSVSVSQTTTFALTCTGPGGSGSDSATVTLNAGDGNGGGGGTGGGGGPVTPAPQPGFTLSSVEGDVAPIQFLASLSATSSPRRIRVNPANGFSSPVTIRVTGIQSKSNGSPLPEGTTARFVFDGGGSTASLSHNASLDEFVGPGGVGTSFQVHLSRSISEPYNVTLVGEGGGRSATYVITVDPRTTNPTYREI